MDLKNRDCCYHRYHNNNNQIIKNYKIINNIDLNILNNLYYYNYKK